MDEIDYDWDGFYEEAPPHRIAPSDEERFENYRKDITYGTNNEIGFDYLRDNMKFDQEEQVQKKYQFAKEYKNICPEKTKKKSELIKS